MNDEHDHHDSAPEPPVTPMAQEDASSQALAEALRSSFAIVKFVMVALVVIFLGSGFFQVGTQEKAIILRFGKTVGQGQAALLGPGLHWSFPYPIDEVVKIPITEIQKISSTIGWFAETPEQELSGNLPPPGPSLVPGVDGYVITADRNIIHTRATLYYQVDDPIRYVFGFTSASNTIQSALNNALLDTAARFKVDDVLYGDVAGFQEAVQQRRGRIGLRAPGAGSGNIGNDGVGAHGESADRLGNDRLFFQELKNRVPGEASALGVERGGAAVDVVIACAARRKLELAETKAGSGEQREQLLGVGRCGHRDDCIGLPRLNPPASGPN